MAKVEINTKAPDFSLPDFSGKVIRVSEFQGKNNILLVFNRTFT